ncbi:MAG: ABC transporter permease [Clostridia bacterium]|nr:ABC transporter permease [Clostridia bacterium]MBR0409327.1 ABC transporter permease [Clostridia bacterium]
MKKESFFDKAGTRSVLASLVAILVGMLAGSVIILIVGLTNSSLGIKGAWEGIRLVVAGLFATGRDAAGGLTFGFNSASFGNMLFRAVPLIMTGLSVALGNKAGLFNIGAPGQYLAGTAASLFVSLSVPTSVVPAWLVWLMALLAGMMAGACWGAIPGLLKAYLNINEVLACIMTNWIAANVVTWIFDISSLKNVLEGTKSGYIYKTSTVLNDVVIDGVRSTVGANIPEGAQVVATRGGVATAKMGLDSIFSGSQVNGGILVAILIAIVIYIILSRTTLGYQLKACGANRYAARYAGIQDKRNIVLTMALAGALAAAGGALYYLSGNTEFFWNTYQSLPAEGFNGIPVALLAINNPLGVVFSAVFMSMLQICGQKLTELTAYNEYITNVIIAVIVYLSAFMLVIKMWIGKLRKGKAVDK